MVGANKYQAILAQGSPAVDVTQQTALAMLHSTEQCIQTFRSGGGKQLLFYMLDRTIRYSYGPLSVASNALKLPNGMYLQYPHLRYNNGEFLYDSGGRYCTVAWLMTTENIVQAQPQIVITDQMLLYKTFPICCTDRAHVTIALGSDKNADETLAITMAIMGQPPAWCTELL